MKINHILWFFVPLAVAEIARPIHYTNKKEIEALDVDTILKSLGTPACMRKCIDSFIQTTSSIWQLQDVANKSKEICSSHAKALACLKADQYCDMKGVFKTASSSVFHMCQKKSLLFEKMDSCLRPVIDSVMQECDSSCQTRSNLTAFAQNPNVKFASQIGGNLFIVSDHIGPLCSSLSCGIPCITQKLNKKCEYSGWLTLDVLMQPLDASAAMAEELPPALRELLEKKIDKKCGFAISTKKLDRIRNGDFTAFDV